VSGQGLVLGGGGPVGAAWYAGLAEGSAEGGLNLRSTDIVIGTSAGAVAGAWLASGAPLSSLAKAMLRRAADHEDANLTDSADLDLVARVYTALSGAQEPLDPAMAREIGSLAVQAAAPTENSNRYVETANYLPGESWPERFRAAVVNAGTGELVLIGPSDEVPLNVGVAASCAAPGLVAPVQLLGGTFVDGGARSATNADVLLQFEVDRALVASPVPSDTPMVGEAIDRVLEHECRRLREAGIEVNIITPTELEREAFGFDLLNLTKMAAAIEAGRERGLQESRRLKDWWAMS
jgi:NTE family protein